MTVLIADDHPLFRRGVARAIRRAPELELVAEAVNGHEALSLVAATTPDVAVLDYRMPGLTGVEVCAELRRRGHARTAVLILTAYDDAELVTAAVSAGAAGYISKTASQGEICAAIEKVGRGGVAYSAAAAPRKARRSSVAHDEEIF